MTKPFANCGDPDQTPHLRHMIWVCTICQLPFVGLHTIMGNVFCNKILLNLHTYDENVIFYIGLDKLAIKVKTVFSNFSAKISVPDIH